MTDAIVSLKTYLEQYGYWAVFGGLLLEDFGLPVPGEALLIAGSIVASQGDLQLLPLLLAAWLGAVCGDNIGYGIGRFGGRPMVLRYGRYILINEKRLAYVEDFFTRHGAKVVIVARFFEILRQLNGVVAGIARMRWWRFFGCNVVGAGIWVGFWGLLFYQLGGKAIRLGQSYKRLELLLLALVIGGLLLVTVRHMRRHKD